MLAEPREALKRAARNGEWEAYARVVNDLFGFERQDAAGTPPAAATPPPPPQKKT
jgi:hypothetical protein